MNIKQFTDDEIIALDTVRKRPCIPEGGECRIVSVDSAAMAILPNRRGKGTPWRK